MEYKREIAENMIAEIELNGFENDIDDWEKMKKIFLEATNSSLLEEQFWDCVETIAKYIGNKVRK